MPLIPPTPLLPTSKQYRTQDQTFLLDATLDFDDTSFGSWPPSPGPARRTISEAGSSELHETEVQATEGLQDAEEDYRVEEMEEGLVSDAETERGDGRFDNADREDFGESSALSGKRIGGDTPMKTHTSKKVKQPTPVRDDFYSRRVKDTDRRSSLGPKDLRVPAASSSSSGSLYRSTSRSSFRSSTSTSSSSHPSRPSDPFQLDTSQNRHLGSAYLTSSLARDVTSTPPSLPEPITPYPLSSRLSTASAATPNLTRHVSLHRSVSQLSTASSSRRYSISEKVTGFLSHLLGRGRRSSVMDIHNSQHDDADRPESTLGADLESTGDAQDIRQDGSGQPNSDSHGEHIQRHISSCDSNEIASAVGLEESRTEEHPHDPAAYQDANRQLLPGGPKLRLPAAVTRPAPRQLTTAARALQPKKVFDPVQNQTGGISQSTKPNRPISRPTTYTSAPLKTTSAFASQALSRLPAPGKGSTSSSRPTEIKLAERARDLAVKRETFERLAKQAEEEKAKSLSKYTSATASTGSKRAVSAGMSRTIPIRGNTPGKASRARAEERARFERGLKERHDEKERRDREVQKAREEMEKEEERVRRLKSVVWAKEVPEMYRHHQRSERVIEKENTPTV